MTTDDTGSPGRTAPPRAASALMPANARRPRRSAPGCRPGTPAGGSGAVVAEVGPGAVGVDSGSFRTDRAHRARPRWRDDDHDRPDPPGRRRDATRRPARSAADQPPPTEGQPPSAGRPGRHRLTRRASPCCRSRRPRCSTPPTPPPRGMVVGVGFVVVAALEVVVGWGLYAVLHERAHSRAYAALVSRAGYAVLLAAAAGRLLWPGRRRRGRVPGRLVARPRSCSACTCWSRRSPSGTPTGARRGGGRHRGGGHGSPARRRGRPVAAARRRSRARGRCCPACSASWCCWPGCPPSAAG